MTNETIIFLESVKAMQEGILKSTGRIIEMLNANGEKEQFEEPEPIHTFQKWKELGYSVKKGEKAKLSFMIWKATKKQLDENTGNDNLDKLNHSINEKGGELTMFMKKASFFTFEQVQPIEEKAI